MTYIRNDHSECFLEQIGLSGSHDWDEDDEPLPPPQDLWCTDTLVHDYAQIGAAASEASKLDDAEDNSIMRAFTDSFDRKELIRLFKRKSSHTETKIGTISNIKSQ